ncbi:MAG: hypothetical protein EZS28_034914, partial [Streblomastix strix]
DKRLYSFDRNVAGFYFMRKERPGESQRAADLLQSTLYQSNEEQSRNPGKQNSGGLVQATGVTTISDADQTISILSMNDDLNTDESAMDPNGFERVRHQLTLNYLIPEPIRWVSAGNQFVVAVAETGEVFTWGKNEKGQLGIGNRPEEIERRNMFIRKKQRTGKNVRRIIVRPVKFVNEAKQVILPLEQQIVPPRPISAYENEIRKLPRNIRKRLERQVLLRTAILTEKPADDDSSDKKTDAQYLLKEPPKYLVWKVQAGEDHVIALTEEELLLNKLNKNII